MTKYAFKIRNHHGVCIDGLHIYGRIEEDARRKLVQMYPRWDIVETREVEVKPLHKQGSALVRAQQPLLVRADYEDVMNLLVKEA